MKYHQVISPTITKKKIQASKNTLASNMTAIEAKLIYCFGEENTKRDLRIGKRFEELFGDLRNKNRNLIRNGKIRRKLMSLFGEKLRKPIKIINKKKKTKKLQDRIKKRFDYLFGLENTKRDKRVAKKIVQLFGPE